MGSIVVAGGYGAFGERVIARLARDCDLDIVVAGRDRVKAEAAVAASWPEAKARLSGARIDATSVTPDELTAMLEAAGLVVTRMQGIAFSPIKGLHLSEDIALNYILSARRA